MADVKASTRMHYIEVFVGWECSLSMAAIKCQKKDGGLGKQLTLQSNPVPQIARRVGTSFPQKC